METTMIYYVGFNGCLEVGYPLCRAQGSESEEELGKFKSDGHAFGGSLAAPLTATS